jgi:mitofusin 2
MRGGFFSLVTAITSTQSILDDLRMFNKEDWVFRYPQLSEQISTPRKSMRRSLTFADEPTMQTDVVMSAEKPGLPRSMSLATTTDEPEEATEEPPSTDFQVLRLDLKIGANGSSTSASSLVSQLEKNSIANLLDERIANSLNYIAKLRLRVDDTSSKVLVTGDLNAGKSTFVNALLRREVMPVDQQPCTTAFCEVRDAAENDNKEEVHIVHPDTTYDITDISTYERRQVADLEDVVAEIEATEQVLKLYLSDTRTPAESLLNNGVVDISLIDAPGLNRDSLKTTAVFARQEEIDVVVFVVSAENHFTLSAKEFLQTASNEKAYVFIVVNKFDDIRNKEKCRRLVLDQIRQLSPSTYEDAEDLVHFVDSASALKPFAANPSFDDLESALRSFVLVKRTKSKLQPVSTYLVNLLSDIGLLASANSLVAEAELERARGDLELSLPVLERMKQSADVLEEGLDAVEDIGAEAAQSKARNALSKALERVGQGLTAVDAPNVTLPPYPGLLGVFDYARDVRRALLSSIDTAVNFVEDEARTLASAGVAKVAELGEQHLPADVERSKRVFLPQAMFTARRAERSMRRRSSGVASASGGVGLGIGLARRSDMLESTFLDIFDIQHHFLVHLGTDGNSKEEATTTALSVFGVGAGALTMVGGHAIGVRGLFEGILRLSDLWGNESTRKWIAPVLGLATVGMTAYVVMELPNSIPRTVGRRIQSSIVHSTAEGEQSFVDEHASRVNRETRKVLRLASYDLKERFRGAMDKKGTEVKLAEDLEKKAEKAQSYLKDIGARTAEARTTAMLTV